jgi:hypothetical protein
MHRKLNEGRTLFSTVHYDMSSLPTLQSLGQRRGPKWPKGTNEILKPSRGVRRRSRTWWWHWVSWGITNCGWKLSHCCDPSGGQAAWRAKVQKPGEIHRDLRNKT